MGRPKMLLPWGKTTVLGHLIQQWRASDARQVTVISADGDAAIFAELDRLGFPLEQRIFNPDPDRGMFSSIQCAARWTAWHAELTSWILVLGDQPHLRDETLRKLLVFAGENSEVVCQPVYKIHRRHPVVIPKNIFRELGHSSAKDLKEFLASYASAAFETDDPGLELDIDEPADYEKARSCFDRNNCATKSP